MTVPADCVAIETPRGSVVSGTVVDISYEARFSGGLTRVLTVDIGPTCLRVPDTAVETNDYE